MPFDFSLDLSSGPRPMSKSEEKSKGIPIVIKILSCEHSFTATKSATLNRSISQRHDRIEHSIGSPYSPGRMWRRRRLGAVSGGHNLRKSLGFSHRRTLNHLQPPSVHDVRLQRVRYVELVAAHITVQVRSQNSNPQDQERYISTGR